MSDGLADAPPWVTSLKTDLEKRGFLVREERRFNQPFGLYAVLLQRERGFVIQISSERTIAGPPVWRINPMAGDYDQPARYPLQSVNMTAVRQKLEGDEATQTEYDGSDEAVWLIEHLDLVSGLVGYR